MHPALEGASHDLSIDLPAIREAASLTRSKFDDARTAAATYLDDGVIGHKPNFDIVVFGSIARDEMSEGSDFDWLVIAHALSQDPSEFIRYRQAAETGREAISAEQPGQSGLFGTIVGSAELVNTIGLDHDTNLSHSRRILLLEESRSLLDSDGHLKLLHAITARYLYDQQIHPGGVPRFLLNDVTRYWRTVAVDYQAKRWQEHHGQKWGSRLLKLRSSRKLTYAGTLVSLFMPALTDTDLSPENLVRQWSMPPLARLAQLSTVLGDRGRDHLRQTLLLADELIRYLSDEKIRTEASKVAHLREAPEGSDLATAAERTITLGQSLQQLFLCDEPIPSCRDPQGFLGLTARYLMF